MTAWYWYIMGLQSAFLLAAVAFVTWMLRMGRESTDSKAQTVQTAQFYDWAKD